MALLTPETCGCRCHECPYSKDKKPNRPVLAVGLLSSQAPYGIVVGESPGAEEVNAGAPFVGATGRELDVIFEKAGLNRHRLVLANAMLCRPVEPKDNNDMARATDACRPYLKSVFRVVENKSGREDTPILMMGKYAYMAVTGKSGYMNERGFLQHGVTTRSIQRVEKSVVQNDDTESSGDSGEWE